VIATSIAPRGPTHSQKPPSPLFNAVIKWSSNKLQTL
jgi:hypothetical protein